MSESLTDAEVAEIAALARLELEPAEAARLAEELGQILEHFAVLADVDTEGVEPMTHVTDLALKLRPDDVGPSLAPEEALGAAPEVEAGCFVVPSSIAPEE